MNCNKKKQKQYNYVVNISFSAHFRLKYILIISTHQPTMSTNMKNTLQGIFVLIVNFENTFQINESNPEGVVRS